MKGRIDLRLRGVPETMLLTLWNRAGHARGPRPFLVDPLALELVERIDYPFRQRFGRPQVTHAIRSRFSDALVQAFLARTPEALVVALGEGLETQLWRVDDGRVQWVSVDLPEAIAARRQLLPAHPRNSLIESSALDHSWLQAVARDGPVFVTAAGLFMYFERDAVVRLLRAVTQHCREGEAFFDTIPPWFSRKTLRGWQVTRHYSAPAMPFGLALGALPGFLASVPGLSLVTALTYAEPYPERLRLFAWLSRSRRVRDRIAPGLVHARFSRFGPETTGSA